MTKMQNKIDEILLSFYNGVEGNLDIRHGYPPIHMDEAKAKLQALLLRERIDELKKMMNGQKTVRSYITNNGGEEQIVTYEFANTEIQERLKSLEAQTIKSNKGKD